MKPLQRQSHAQFFAKLAAILCAGLTFWVLTGGIGGAQVTPSPEPTSLPSPVLDFVHTYQVLFGGVLGTGLGVLGKWIFDQISAERAARRQFAQQVTKQISDLATNHYWSLANYAGILAGQLESYLDNRDHYLMLNFKDHKDLETSLEALADETARASFHQFCRLIVLFDDFQFRSSNTYLLTSHAAGEMSKKLYNAFVSNIPTGAKNSARQAENIDTLKIVKLMRKKAKEDPAYKGMSMAEVPAVYFIDELTEGEAKSGLSSGSYDKSMLSDELQAYRHWIWQRIPEVEQAVDALRAYNALLSHELALLYRDFFKDGSVNSKLYLSNTAYDDWPHVITEKTFLAIERASVQSALLQPLGDPTHGKGQGPGSTKDAADQGKSDSGKQGTTDGKLERRKGRAEDVAQIGDQPDPGKSNSLVGARAAQISGGPDA